MRKEKNIESGHTWSWYLLFCSYSPKYTHNMRAKRSTTVGNSIRENAKLPLQQPMMTVRGTAYISRTHGIRMHIQKKVLPGNRLVSPYADITANWQTKQIFLKLDAASKAAAIYMNGRKIGEHNGGYTACTFDITTFCSLTLLILSLSM